jgi:hypothetical protein
MIEDVFALPDSKAGDPVLEFDLTGKSPKHIGDQTFA